MSKCKYLYSGTIKEKGGIHKAKAEFSEAEHGEGPCPPPEDVSEQLAGVPNHKEKKNLSLL